MTTVSVGAMWTFKRRWTLIFAGFCAQTKHEEELSALRSHLDAKEEQAASVSQDLAAAKAALSEAEQVLHAGLSHDFSLWS